MSLRKAIRNARKASNYSIGTIQGVSFDLTTEEGREAGREWRERNPGPVIPDGWDGGKIRIQTNDGLPRESIELTED